MFFIGVKSVVLVPFASVQNIPKYYTILYLYITVIASTQKEKASNMDSSKLTIQKIYIY